MYSSSDLPYSLWPLLWPPSTLTSPWPVLSSFLWPSFPMTSSSDISHSISTSSSSFTVASPPHRPHPPGPLTLIFLSHSLWPPSTLTSPRLVRSMFISPLPFHCALYNNLCDGSHFGWRPLSFTVTTSGALSSPPYLPHPPRGLHLIFLIHHGVSPSSTMESPPHLPRRHPSSTMASPPHLPHLPWRLPLINCIVSTSSSSSTMASLPNFPHAPFFKIFYRMPFLSQNKKINVKSISISDYRAELFVSIVSTQSSALKR